MRSLLKKVNQFNSNYRIKIINDRQGDLVIIIITILQFFNFITIKVGIISTVLIFKNLD